MNDKSAPTDANRSNPINLQLFTTLTWNIEGLSRNVHNLHHFISEYDPDFVLLSEPQTFACDVDNIMAYLRKDYEFSLNSPDKFDLSLPMTKSKAYGGTMLLWKRELDPYVTLYPPTSCAALPI